MAKDYYAILGVSRTAAPEEIQAAYRKMSQLYHPDVNAEAFAGNIYQKVTEARDTLIDPERRRSYDASLTPEPAVAPVPPVPPRIAPAVPVAGPVSPPGPSVSRDPSPENPSPGTARDADLRAFYAERLRAEKAGSSTFGDWLGRKEVLTVVGGSILLIDALAWLFGLRLAQGATFGFLFRSSALVFVGWGGYLGLRYYTKSVPFALAYSLFYAVIYAMFVVRIYFDPLLYPDVPPGSAIGRQIAVHFSVFYLVFFCAVQSLEEGGLKTVYDRAVGRRQS